MADTETYISLFAGTAGLDLALGIAKPGVRCIGYCEREYPACEVLAARMEEGSIDIAPIFTDVRTFPSELYRGRVAGIVAGFPCPDYSVAGKRAGIVGKHGQLWDYLAATIRDVGPDWVFLENVSGIYVPHGADDGAVLPAGLWFVLGDLAGLGFDAQWMRLRASDVGASHGRARWFCLAYRKGGGFRIGRESSGCNGFADGSYAELGNTAGNGQPRLWSGLREQSCAIGGSGPRELAGTPRHERNGSRGEAGARRGVCEAGDRVADAGHGQLPQSRRGPQGRNGAGSAEPVLGNPDIPRLEGRDERGCGLPDERIIRAAGDPELADAECEPRRAQCEQDAGGRTDREPHRRSMPYDVRDIPLFAPGPGATAEWQRILRDHPHLAPAISTEETESLFRGVFAGRADEFDIEDRTDRLRALGNMVCPMQGAVAFTLLAQRAGLIR